MKNMLWAALAVGAAVVLTIYLVQQKNKKELEERQRGMDELDMVRAPQHAMG
jgi:hypothetical protein